MSRINILEAIDIVRDSASSIFTKEDVLNLLDKIDADIPNDPLAAAAKSYKDEREETITVTRGDIANMCADVAEGVATKFEEEYQDWLGHMARNCDVSWGLDGDRIVVDDVTITDDMDFRWDESWYEDRIDELFEEKNNN